MPKATLLKPDYIDYTLIYGNRSYSFIGGKQVSVSVVVAEELKKRVDDKKKPLFKVIDNLPPMATAPIVTIVAQQNVIGKLRQLRVEECL